GYPAFAGYDGQSLQLRLVALVDQFLALPLAEAGLGVDHFADARHHRPLDAIAAPQFRAHQRLAAVEIDFADVDPQRRARRLAELDHRGQQFRLRGDFPSAADAQRLVDPRHEEDQLHEARAFD